MPDKLPFRERELDMLEATIRAITGRLSGVAYILGRPGLGKTVISLRFAQSVSERGAVPLYVNCRKYRSSSLVMSKILRLLNKGFPERGLSFSELVLMLEESLKDLHQDILIILDEIGYVRDGGDLIYSLFRVNEGTEIPPPAIIMISREWMPKYLLDRSILSFIKMRIRLDPYREEELLEILRYRAQLGLRSGSYTKDVLSMIAGIAAPHGDARYAINILYQSASIAESSSSEKILPEHVREALSSEVPLVDRGVLLSLDIHEKLLLMAATRLLEKSHAPQVPIGKVEEEYRVLCESYDVPHLKHTALWRRVKSLDSAGLISTRKSSKGVKGQTTLISIEYVSASSIYKELKTMLDQDLGSV